MMSEQKNHILLSNFLKWKIIIFAVAIILHIFCALNSSVNESMSKFSDSDPPKIGQPTDARCGPMSLLSAYGLLGVKANIDKITKL